MGWMTTWAIAACVTGPTRALRAEALAAPANQTARATNEADLNCKITELFVFKSGCVYYLHLLRVVRNEKELV
jgi:hypothetical protein